MALESFWKVWLASHSEQGIPASRLATSGVQIVATSDGSRFHVESTSADWCKKIYKVRLHVIPQIQRSFSDATSFIILGIRGDAAVDEHPIYLCLSQNRLQVSIGFFKDDHSLVRGRHCASNIHSLLVNIQGNQFGSRWEVFQQRSSMTSTTKSAVNKCAIDGRRRRWTWSRTKMMQYR